MKVTNVISWLRGSEPQASMEGRHIPLVVSPIESVTVRRNVRISSGLDPDEDFEPMFKRRHEPSSIELFFDLFFVANLASFTTNHDVNNGSTFRSYLGFFSLLWATWFQTSLYDVRFAYDSWFLRICRAVHVGVQMGFIVAGATFSTNPAYASASSFRRIALSQMVSRFMLAIQYASICWYVRKYSKTRVPLLLMTAVMLIAGFIYLGTYFGFSTMPSKVYYTWYIIAPIEVVSCVIISSVWSVLSFKDTYLVERIGLLTLIIIGEGIIGISKSVSYLLKANVNFTARDTGVLICATLLIYLIWMLYFDQIQDERFGSIKQQVWTLLHYPLHLCILFTVEGSTNLYTWVTAAPYDAIWSRLIPPIWSENLFFQAFPDVTSLVNHIQQSVDTLDSYYKYKYNPSQYYDYSKNLTFFQNNSNLYGTTEYFNDTIETIGSLWLGMSNGIFQTYNVNVTNPDLHGANNSLVAELYEIQGVADRYTTVFYFFFIAAGLFLLVLSILYIIGNKRKTGGEWCSLAFRTFIGIGITMTLVGVTQGPYIPTVLFITSPWLGIIVTLAYLIVIIADNIFVERAVHKQRQNAIPVDPLSKQEYTAVNTIKPLQHNPAVDSDDTVHVPEGQNQRRF